MQAELVYYGKFTELSYLDSIPWNQFIFYHTWLRTTKKEEADAQKKQRQEQESKMHASRSRRSPSPRRR